MKYARALGAGTIGAAATVALLLAARQVVGVDGDASAVLAALVPGTPLPSRLVGVAIQIGGGAAAALLYGLVFEHVTRRATWWLGAALGAAHGVAAGLVVGAASARLPADAADLAPGALMLYRGLPAALAFVLAHVVYGAVVGAAYGRVLRTAREPVVRWREVYPARRPAPRGGGR